MTKTGKTAGPEGQPADYISGLDNRAGWIRFLVAAVIILAALCAVMPQICFQDRIFLVPDSKAPISFAEVGKEALEKGTYPLWNPYIFSGMPSYSSMMYNPYVYPVSWITHLLHRYLFFPQMTWLLIHYFMAGIGMYLLMKSFKLSFMISIIGGVLFITLPNYLAMGANGHGSQACAVAYMPFALLLARKMFMGTNRLAMGGLLSVVLGIQMLRGHVQISYYTFLVIGLIYLFEAAGRIRAGEWKKLGLDSLFLALVLFFAVSIASILIFPLRHYAQYSIRGGGAGGGLDFGYATGWSLHPKETLTFILPWASGYGKATYWGSMPFTDYPNYLGVVTVVFATAAMFMVRKKVKWLLFSLVFLATLLAYGRHFPLYGLLFRYFPYFNKFRVPVMVLIVQQIAAIPLMGMGIERVVSAYHDGSLPREKLGRILKWSLGGCALLTVLFLLSSGGIRSGVLNSSFIQKARLADLAAERFSRDLIRTAVLLTALAAVLFAGFLKNIRKGYIVLALGVVMFIDMYSVSQPVIHPEDTWNHEGYKIIQPSREKEEYGKPDESTRFLMNDDSVFRIFPAPAAKLGNWSHNVPPFSENKYMIAGVFSTGGYHAAKLQIYQELMDSMFAAFNVGKVPAGILNMLNVKYILSKAPLFRESEIFPLVWHRGSEWIYENTASLPRIFLVDKTRVMSEDDMLSYMRTSAFDPAGEVLVSAPLDIRDPSTEGASARIEEYGLNRLEISAQADHPCVLVISEIYYPDWKAEINGERREIIRADYCLRALKLEKGDHKITLEYDSSVIRSSLILSVSALVLSLLMGTAGWIRQRRKVG